MGDYTIFKRPRYCPNARAFGFSKHSVEVGDLVLYREEYVDGTAGRRLARVLGLANRCPDGSEHGDMLAVLAANDMMTCAYERFVKLADVEEVRAPSESAFAAWFLSGPVPRPEVAIDAVKYGAMNDRAIDRYLQDGELRKTFRNRDKVGDGKVRCPECQGPTHRCKEPAPCHHCDDEDCGWCGLVEEAT
jgi:hypothetical protein